MNCITTKRTWARSQLIREELVAENRDRSETYRILNGLKLTIAGGSYAITNAKGETIRQGMAEDTPASIFEVYDSTSFPVGPLELETPSYSGNFYDYENEHGFGRVARDVKTKWRAYTETLPEEAEETAIGLIRYNGQYTYEIHSLYIPERLSRREKSDYIADYVNKRLAANEYASINAVGITNRWTDEARLYGETYRHRYEQARLLHNDALERQASVSEVFDTGVKYEVKKLFEETEGETDAPGQDETEAKEATQEAV